jgi:alkylation response protein AidB-like acyl-CoA dehydrogenase
MINAGGTFLPPEEMREIMARGRWITAGVAGRIAGKVERVQGGYRVSGRWPFASGAPFATYHSGSSRLYDDGGQPELNPETGQPLTVQVVWPATESRIHDTWDGLGLRGTGSVDIEIEDLFVPESHVSVRGSRRPYGGALYKASFQLMGHCAHALGIARCAIDAFVALVQAAAAGAPRGSYRQQRLGLQQAHQIAVAKAESLVQAARLFSWDATEQAWQSVQGDGSLDRRGGVLMMQAIIYAVRASKEAVELVFEQAGTSAVFRGRSLERCFRDIATAAQHTLTVETSYESIGQYYLSQGGPESAGVSPSFAAPPNAQQA